MATDTSHKSKKKRSTSHNQRRKRIQREFTTQLESKAITNLSDHTLTQAERELLTRGLSYAPSYNTAVREIRTYRDEFIRRLNIDYHFADKPPSKKTLRSSTIWSPPISDDPRVTAFTQDLHSIIRIAEPGGPTLIPDMHPSHRAAINSLVNNTDITIKKADKGGSIVIMNKQDYIHKAKEHLSQPNVYKTVTKDHTQDTADKVNSYITYLHKTMQISSEIADSATPEAPTRTPLFYFLPKIHKEGIPPRPIISGCSGPTDNLSRYLTTVLNPIAQAQPSYLRDTKHFLQLLEDLPPLPTEAILVTADVSSLYTNIPQDEGVQAVMDALQKHRDLVPRGTPSSGIIGRFLQLILEHNYFDFLDSHYLQIQGTAMGTKMACPYANIFMAMIETKLTSTITNHLALWKRFIDDIFFIWLGSQESLQDFMRTANTLHPTIKFTFESSDSQVHFLDTTVYLDESRRIRTTLYRKPTDKNLLLHYDSHHPLHVKRGIIYAQALRYKRIISDPAHLVEELRFLKRVFLARKYPMRLIQTQFNKAKLIPRKTLLTDRPRPSLRQTTGPLCKLPFGPPTHHTMKQHIRHSWNRHLVGHTKRQSVIWPHPPRFITKRGPNLKDTLVRAKQLP